MNLYDCNFTSQPPDFSDADLTGLDLSGKDLTRASMERALLEGADLSGACLRHADLTGADLTGAVLRGADLTGACLRYADLAGADFTGACLRDAELDFAEADAGTILFGADLTDARLEDCLHISIAQESAYAIQPIPGSSLYYELYAGEDGLFRLAIMDSTGTCIYFYATRRRRSLATVLNALRSGVNPVTAGWRIDFPKPQAELELVRRLAEDPFGSVQRIWEYRAR